MADKNLNDLFLDTLKDIYCAEKQIYKSLPKMAKAAQSPDLRAAFEKHEVETEGQIERLEQIFELLDAPARGKKCDAIEGILDEGKEITLLPVQETVCDSRFWPESEVRFGSLSVGLSG
jgi:ferritin-like metal-binding protein YciE